ncbi:MAG: hypothetical protein AAGC55_22730, partial [Myxococcota bacterium]
MARLSAVREWVQPERLAAGLRQLAPWSRARRWRKFEYDPARAPHLPLVDSLVSGHLPELTLRLRRWVVDDLILRILYIETTAVPLTEESRPKQLLLLISRMQQVIEQIEDEQEATRRKFARFSDTFARTDDPEQQHFLITEYLTNTSDNPIALRGDLQALSRFLGYDVLRERNDIALAEMSVRIEVAVSFIGRASQACLSHEDRSSRPGVKEFLGQTRTDRFLAERLQRGDRWQVRLAAGDALLRIYEQSVPGVRAAVAHETVLSVVDHCSHNTDEHPWVQAKAVEISLVVTPDRARALIHQRL